MKIATILGARPQFIKAASLSRELKKHGIKETIIHTGQHYDENMSDVFFDELSIPKPHYKFSQNAKNNALMLVDIMRNLEPCLAQIAPDFVLVYGDTNSTLAGAMSAVKLKIKLVHIESGLRSFNMNMPEELNRIYTDNLSDFLFAPSVQAVQNLKKEGIEKNVFLSGDVMKDGANFYKTKAKKPKIKLDSKFYLATIHRAENTNNLDNLQEIFSALESLAKTTQVVCPLHPRTKNALLKLGKMPNLTFTDPLGYLEMIYLLDKCSLIITDSGGLQKEAFFFEKPCITCRDQTEWTELVEHNFNILATTKEQIINATTHNFNTNFNLDLYGNKACEKIASKLKGLQ